MHDTQRPGWRSAPVAWGTPAPVAPGAAPEIATGDAPRRRRRLVVGLVAGGVLLVAAVMALGVVAFEQVRSWIEDPYTVAAWQEANPHRTDRDTSTLPLLEWHDCPFAREPQGADVACATLVVPADRRPGADSSEVMELAVAVLPALGEPRDDPVLYLEGGPGGPAVGWYDEWMLDGWPSQEDRDLILLDQRGTGYSSPQLGCPEYLEAMAYEEVAAMRTCHDRFRAEGVDLSTVSTPEHAADVEDLRVAMGIQRWNLLGTSYGSRIALRVMDLYPEGVRSAVLDSAYPPQVESLYHEPASAAAAIDALFAACAADAACAGAYPDLAGVFERAIAQLDRDPVELDGVQTTGDDLVYGVVQALYDPTMPALLPRLVSTVESDPDAALEELFEGLGYLAYGTERGSRSTVPTWRESDGTFFSVECREEAATIDRSEALARASSVRSPASSALSGQLRLTLDICDLWDSGVAEPWERDPVEADIPTLVLAGSLDPVTPPEWGRLTSSGLPASTFVEFPDLGHALVLGGSCPLSLMEQHIQRPGDPIDDGCWQARAIAWSLEDG